MSEQRGEERDNSLNDPQQMKDDLLMEDAEPLSGTIRPGSGVPSGHEPNAGDRESDRDTTVGREVSEETRDDDESA